MMKIYDYSTSENLFTICRDIVSQNLEYFIEVSTNYGDTQKTFEMAVNEIAKKLKDNKSIKKVFGFLIDLFIGFYHSHGKYGKKVFISIAIQNESVIVLTTLHIEIVEVIEHFRIMDNINHLTLQEVREKANINNGRLGGSWSPEEHYINLAHDCKSNFILDNQNLGKTPLEFIVTIE